jgi:hypothetical protein
MEYLYPNQQRNLTVNEQIQTSSSILIIFFEYQINLLKHKKLIQETDANYQPPNRVQAPDKEYKRNQKTKLEKLKRKLKTRDRCKLPAPNTSSNNQDNKN